MNKKIKHEISIVVDRIILNNEMGNRLADSVEPALNLSGGLLFEMEVEAIGNIGDITSISFSKSILNDDEISNNSLNLTLSEGLFEVSGFVNYYSNDNYTVESVNLNLLGYSEYNNPYEFSIIDTLTSVSSNVGEYSFGFGLKVLVCFGIRGFGLGLEVLVWGGFGLGLEVLALVWD